MVTLSVVRRGPRAGSISTQKLLAGGGPGPRRATTLGHVSHSASELKMVRLGFKCRI